MNCVGAQVVLGKELHRSDTEPWIEKYVFPGGVTPTEEQLARAREGLLVLHDEATFWSIYDRPAYTALKQRYGPAGRFPDLYAKAVGRF